MSLTKRSKTLERLIRSLNYEVDFNFLGKSFRITPIISIDGMLTTIFLVNYLSVYNFLLSLLHSLLTQIIKKMLNLWI